MRPRETWTSGDYRRSMASGAIADVVAWVGPTVQRYLADPSPVLACGIKSTTCRTLCVTSSLGRCRYPVSMTTISSSKLLEIDGGRCGNQPMHMGFDRCHDDASVESAAGPHFGVLLE